MKPTTVYVLALLVTCAVHTPARTDTGLDDGFRQLAQASSTFGRDNTKPFAPDFGDAWRDDSPGNQRRRSPTGADPYDSGNSADPLTEDSSRASAQGEADGGMLGPDQAPWVIGMAAVAGLAALAVVLLLVRRRRSARVHFARQLAIQIQQRQQRQQQSRSAPRQAPALGPVRRGSHEEENSLPDSPPAQQRGRAA